MYLATLDTPNFGFVVLEDTQKEALELMRKAWEKHREQTRADWDWDFVSDSVCVTFVRCGDVRLDGELIHSYDTPNGWNQTTINGDAK